MLPFRDFNLKNQFPKRRHVTAWIDLLRLRAWKPGVQARLPSTPFFMSQPQHTMATQTNLHIGHLIKSVFDESGMTISEFARQIHLERTTVYSIFERPTVDVLQLARISLVLKHNFLSDVEQHFGLAPQRSSLTLHLDNLSPEMATQLADLLNAASI